MPTLVSELIQNGIIEPKEVLNQNGFICSITIRRLRGSSISPKELGLEDMEHTEEFLKDYISNSAISFLGAKRDSKLNAIESKCRSELASYTDIIQPRGVTSRKRVESGVFLFKDQLQEFKKSFFRRRHEFFEVAAEYLNEWDTIQAQFESSLRTALETYNPRNAEEVLNKIMAKFPDKSKYEESLQFSLIPRPVVTDISDPDLEMFVSEQTETGVNQALKPLLFSLFNICERISYEYAEKEGVIKETTKKNFLKIIDRANDNNIFDLPFFRNDSSSISLIDEKLVITAEDLATEVYQYCKKINIEDSLVLGNLDGIVNE